MCQHNSALSLIADVLPNEQVEAARGHLLNPPEDMVKIGSPSAAQFLFEAFELCLAAYDAVKPVALPKGTRVLQDLIGCMAGRSLPVREHGMHVRWWGVNLSEQIHVVGHERVVFNMPYGGGQLFEALYDCAAIRAKQAEALVGD